MPKKAISVTLDADNLLWLRTQTAAGRRRSLSELLDAIVTDARHDGRADAASIRSVVNTIDVNADDPNLQQADAHIRSLFEASAKRPFLVRERLSTSGKRSRRRRG